MAQMRRVMTVPKGALGLLICARINEQIDAPDLERLALFFKILRNRFSANITLGLGGDGLGPRTLSNWLADGIVDQTICSGHSSMVLNDLVDAAIRSNALTAVFADVRELLRSPDRVLKFIVEHFGMATATALNADASLWQAGQLHLREMPKTRFPANWDGGLRCAHAMCQPKAFRDRSISIEPAPTAVLNTPHHLFVTETGLRRLGGWDRLKARPVRFGGVPVEKFDYVTCLSLAGDLPEGELHDSWEAISGINRSKSDNESVVFDIWPAPYSLSDDPSSSDGTWIDVPRQILVGRRCPVSLSVETPMFHDFEAVYIMSNFNKDRYLHAALYGWLMQTHPTVRLEIVDDISTDASVDRINEFQNLLEVDLPLINVNVNEAKRGTYWIRNLIISRNQRENVVFFINDSDDVSSALRTTLQIGALMSLDDVEACLFNIVRVDSNYSPLPLNNEVERYGTASLCFKSKLIDKVGFFQNIKKNADTEFIRRVKRFFGNSALPWIKLPVMFQPFDGENLTADIYSLATSGGKLTAANDLRGIHIEIAERHHQTLNLENLPDSFGFPLSTLPTDYAALGADFLIDGYRLPDSIVVVMQRPDVEKEKEFLRRGYAVMTQQSHERWHLKAADGIAIESDGGFVEFLREYSARNSLHAYVISSDLVDGLDSSLVSEVELMDRQFSDLVLRSKARGDKYIMKSDGSWHDVGIYVDSGFGGMPHGESKQSQEASRNDRNFQIPVLMHTSSLLQ